MVCLCLESNCTGVSYDTATAFISQIHKSCTVAFCCKAQILRLESWHFLPRPALGYNPELLRDPETACSETHLPSTPVRGVGYCSLTTWTKRVFKYWINNNPRILSGYKWCTNPAGIREIRRLQWIWWENPEATFLHKVYLFLHIIVNSLLFSSSYCSRH